MTMLNDLKQALTELAKEALLALILEEQEEQQEE
jgi:hypothetical protein